MLASANRFRSQPGVPASEVTRLIAIHTLIARSPGVLPLLWGVTLPFFAFASWLFLFLAFETPRLPWALLAGSFLLIGATLLAGAVEPTLHYLKDTPPCA